MRIKRKGFGLIVSFILLVSMFLSVLVVPLPIAKASPAYSWSTFTVAASGDDVELLAYTGWSNYTTDGDNLWVHSDEYTTYAWLRFEGLSAITDAGGVIDQIILSMYSGADEGADYEEVPGGYVSVACPMYDWDFELTESNILAADMNPVASFDGDNLSPSGAWYNKTISNSDPRDWYSWTSNFNDVFICYVAGFMQYSPDWTYYRSFTSFDEGHPAKIYVKYHGDHQGYEEVLDYFDVESATYVQTWNNYNYWAIPGTEANYSKSLLIEGTPGAGTNYAVRIHAHYGEGNDSGEDVYLGGNAREDFGDVRFTSDGTTELDYWMERRGAYLVNFTKLSNNPLKDLGDGYWFTSFYNNYSGEDKIYLMIQESAAPETDMNLWSFDRANANTPSSWTDHGAVITGAEAWEDYHREPHSVIFETQAMADAREGGTGTRKWRLYYCGIDDGLLSNGQNYRIGIATAPENDPTNWTREEALNPIYGPNGAYGVADPEAFIKNDEVWMAVALYNGGGASQQEYYTISTDGITNWRDMDDVDLRSVAEGPAVVWGESFIHGNDEQISTLMGYSTGAKAFSIKDGRTFWEYEDNPVMASGGAGAWDEDNSLCTIPKTKDGNYTINGITYLFYFGKLAGDYKIGGATSVDFDGDAYFWVEVEEDLGSNQTIYIHYGNTAETYPFGADQTLMDDTFIFSDHFYGTAINETKWNLPVGGGYDISNSELSLTQLAASRCIVRSVDTFGPNISLEFKARATGNSAALGMDDDAGNNRHIHIVSNIANQANVQNKVGGGAAESSFYAYNVWTLSRVFRHYWEPDEIKYYNEETLKATHNTDIPTTSLYIKNFSPTFNDYNTSIDWTFIRKYIDPEPSPDTWGEEEVGNVTEDTYVATDPDGNVITPDPFDDIDDCEDFVENWDEDYSPVLAISIANIDAVEWVFEGKKRYDFTVIYINVNLTDIDQVGVGFTDEINHFHSVWYDRDANTLTVTSPEDGISGWLHSISQTDINVTAVFHIMFNVPIPDSYDVSAYARIVDTADSGWVTPRWGEDGLSGELYLFNIYNLGGLSTLTKSGTAGRVTGGDIFEIYAADTRTRNIVPVQDFDVRAVPLPEGWQVLGIQLQAAGDEQILLEEVQGWKWWLSTRTENQTIHPTNRKPGGAATNDLTYVSWPFGLKIKANPTTSNGMMGEKQFWRKIEASDNEIVTVQVHAMTPQTTGTTGKILITDDGYVNDLNARVALDSLQVVDLVFAGNGSMRLTDGVAGYIYPATYTGMTWYNFTFVINCTAQNYDMYVDEVLNATDVDFRQKVSGADSVGHITFMDISMAGNFTEFYVDDLWVYTDFDADYGGYAEATMLFKHLQHWSMDFDFFVENGQVYAQGASHTPQRVWDDYQNYGYVELGWDVMLNETYVNDFLVARVNITDGYISGKNDWIKFNVTWYKQGVYIKNDLLYGLFEGYSIYPGGEKDTVGFHWDIWFNRANASTVIGARINTEFYGMSDKSVWWAVWSSKWKPMRTEVSESTIFIDLEDANATIHSAKDVLFVRSKVKVLRNTLAQFSYKVLNIAGLDFVVARDTMSGIDTPPIRDTVVPDILSGFFGSALGGIFSAALKRLGNTLAGFGMGFFSMSIDFIDNVFAALGYPALVSTIFGWMDSLFSSVPTLVGYGITMIGNVFTLINVSASNTLIQLASVVTIWAGMYSTTMDMLNGVMTPGINLWNDLGINSFIQIGAILYPLWLLIMGKDKGMQAVIDHLNGVLNIGSFFLNFILNVGGFFMGLLTGLIGAIRG